MKTNSQKDHRPFHLHLEYFFRKQVCLGVVLGLLLVALIKTDGRAIGVVRQAYAQGFGMIGQYMREEASRVPVTFDITGRMPTMSGR